MVEKVFSGYISAWVELIVACVLGEFFRLENSRCVSWIFHDSLSLPIKSGLIYHIHNKIKTKQFWFKILKVLSISSER